MSNETSMQLDRIEAPPAPRSPRGDTWHFTKAGNAMGLAAIVLIAIGLFKGINLLVLLGCLLLVLLGLNFSHAGRRVRRLQVQRLLPEAVFAHAGFPLEIVVTNSASRAQGGVRLEDSR